MKHPLLLLLLVVSMGYPASHVLANSGHAPSYRVVAEQLQIHHDGERATIRMTITAIASGVIRVRTSMTPLAANHGARFLSGDTNVSMQLRAGDTAFLRMELDLPNRGYYRLTDSWIEVDPANTDGRDHLVTQGHRSMYVDTRPGASVIQSSAPIADADRRDRSMEGKLDRGPSTQQEYQIHVHVWGRVVFPVAGQSVGVPNVPVHLDWDSDDEPMNGTYTPYSGHDDYRTNDDGTYDIDFTFTSSSQIPELAQTAIRVWATAANTGAAEFQGALNFAETQAIPTNGLTTEVIADADNLEVDPERGGALRYLYRASIGARGLFNANGRTYDLPRIFYVIDLDWWSSLFCSDETAGCYDNISGIAYIIFNERPGSEVSYHEWGHYFHWAWGSWISGSCPDPHAIGVVSNPACAWREGFAEFMCGALHDFWYGREMPQRYEDPRGGYLYQILDNGRTAVPIHPPEESEGGVACMLYNLTDDVPTRSPGFAGDDEDLGYIPEAVVRSTKFRFNGAGQELGATPIESTILAFQGMLGTNARLLPALPYHLQSVDALFNSIGSSTAVQHPATPTVMSAQIVGYLNLRVRLDWNNNTEPALLNVTSLSMGTWDVPLFRNNEAGFRIYRKKLVTLEPWDGRTGRLGLDPEYVLVGSAPSDATTWTDPALLGPGRYSYVVVAFNSASGESIPKAEARIAMPSSVIIGPSEVQCHDRAPDYRLLRIPAAMCKTLVAHPSGPAISYEWFVENKPDFLVLSGEYTDELHLCNNYAPPMPVPEDPLVVRCVVYDGQRYDTSAPFYPLVSPRDDQPSMIAYRVANGVVPDTNSWRNDAILCDNGRFVHTTEMATARPAVGADGKYHVLISGLAHGTTEIDKVGLFAVDHSNANQLSGNSCVGFTLTRTVGDTVVTDSIPAMAFELRLSAVRLDSATVDTMIVRVIDGLTVPLAPNQTLDVGFDIDAHGLLPDTTFTRDFLVEIQGRFTDSALWLGGRPIGSSSPPVAQPIRQGAGGLSVTPNPASSMVIVEGVSWKQGSVTVEFVDALGRPVRTSILETNGGGFALHLDVTGLPAGVYSVVVADSQQSVVERSVILR